LGYPSRLLDFFNSFFEGYQKIKKLTNRLLITSLITRSITCPHGFVPLMCSAILTSSLMPNLLGVNSQGLTNIDQALLMRLMLHPTLYPFVMVLFCQNKRT